MKYLNYKWIKGVLRKSKIFQQLFNSKKKNQELKRRIVLYLATPNWFWQTSDFWYCNRVYCCTWLHCFWKMGIVLYKLQTMWSYYLTGAFLYSFAAGDTLWNVELRQGTLSLKRHIRYIGWWYPFETEWNEKAVKDYRDEECIKNIERKCKSFTTWR